MDIPPNIPMSCMHKSFGMNLSLSVDKSGSDEDSENYTRFPKRMRVGVVTKCVKVLRARYQADIMVAMGFKDLLRDSRLDNIEEDLKTWLMRYGLPKSIKVDCVKPNKFRYKPKYDIPNARAFLTLLRDHERRGLGGIWLEDIKESLPHAEKVLEKTRDSYHVVYRKVDKRVVIYYRKKSLDIVVNPGLQDIWQEISVAYLTDSQIEAHLKSRGIRPFMAWEGPESSEPNELEEVADATDAAVESSQVAAGSAADTNSTFKVAAVGGRLPVAGGIAAGRGRGGPPIGRRLPVGRGSAAGRGRTAGRGLPSGRGPPAGRRATNARGSRPRGRIAKLKISQQANAQKMRDNAHVAHLLKNYNEYGHEVQPEPEPKKREEDLAASYPVANEPIHTNYYIRV
ncbi:uncharacterized protein LOC115625669 [Scaptodrosophila lebanonensis]|uniref:Uncharacterized protein LOC115625669 n=1 Tax=Drosophila lebanonensis TaxID=7225 RepID=A0A6J2TKW1_DROLE|nr:uncharacterized protein LOC115625669 [Scaptodrosophila lebanonensis]